MKKKTIEDCRGLAESRGGKCLSEVYVNAHGKLQWECKIGHEWSTTYMSVKSGSWCKNCGIVTQANKMKSQDGLKTAQMIAKSKGGECLSSSYTNAHTKMKFICGLGHEWEATMNNVKGKGKWCYKCGRLETGKKLTLKNAICIAKMDANEKGGRCLSMEYVGIDDHMRWECAEGHKWESTFYNVVRRGYWCPECGRLSAAKKFNNSLTLTHWKTGEELICVASYEKAVVEYLNFNRVDFKWQPKTFTTNILTKTGKLSTYRPDLYLHSTKKWVEIKGYFREKDKVKWDWFQTIKPNSELWDKDKLKEMGVI